MAISGGLRNKALGREELNDTGGSFPLRILMSAHLFQKQMRLLSIQLDTEAVRARVRGLQVYSA